MKHILFTSLLALATGGAMCLSCNNSNQPQSSMQKLETYFDSISPRMMYSILVTKGDSVVFSRNNGFADVGNKIPITDTTGFRIGSISKTYTALMVLQAVKENRLSLDDKLCKFFPNANFPNAGTVTIDHLLRHRSGLHTYTSEEADYYSWFQKPLTHEQMVELMAKLKPDFEPGAQFWYSNTGYLLLGYILEQVYNKPYNDILQEKVARPLGLKHTYSPTDTFIVNSYAYDDGWQLQPKANPCGGEGCGGIVSNKGELSVFFSALFGGKFGQDILNQMTDLTGFYGRGLFAVADDEGKIIGYGHDGAIDAFRSSVQKRGDYMVIVLTNCTGFNLEAVGWTISQALCDKEFGIPNLNFITLDPSNLDPLVGNFKGLYPKLGQDSVLMTVRSNGKCLLMEPNIPGGYEVKMEPYSRDVFYNPSMDVSIKFVDNNNSMEIRDGGMHTTFSRKK